MTTEVREQYEATMLELRRIKALNEAWKLEVETLYPWRQHDARIFQERADEAEFAILVCEQMVAAL